jgi:hypothetical protein
MNTIIPNEVRFDLDLQDLPARAVGVSSDALGKVSGAGCKLINTQNRFNGGKLEGFCKQFCGVVGPTCGIHRVYAGLIFCGCWTKK